MANSKPGIYEILCSDGSKTRVHANSKTAAGRAVGGRKITITRVADSWPDQPNPLATEETLESLEGEDPHAIDQYLRTGGPR